MAVIPNESYSLFNTQHIQSPLCASHWILISLPKAFCHPPYLQTKSPSLKRVIEHPAEGHIEKRWQGPMWTLVYTIPKLMTFHYTTLLISAELIKCLLWMWSWVLLQGNEGVSSTCVVTKAWLPHRPRLDGRVQRTCKFWESPENIKQQVCGLYGEVGLLEAVSLGLGLREKDRGPVCERLERERTAWTNM